MKCITILLLITLALPSLAADAPPPNDYGNSKNWLCRPDANAACNIDLSTTAIADDGTLTRADAKADATAPIDCFYVYPTVSTDRGFNSDMQPDAAEFDVVRQQFARFGVHCRLFAPMYRQVTRVGLLSFLISDENAPAQELALPFDDIRDAWHYYLEHDNKGRGVVLIGHSQGSTILKELIAREIDGKPLQRQLVSAMLAGTTVAVANGKDIGGTFQHIPLCHAADQPGCVIVYSSFRATAKPPANTRFGHVEEAGMTAACTNPAALGGGSGDLKTYFARDSRAVGAAKSWLTPEQPIATPWITLPGLISAECKTNEYATYLEITLHGDPATPRLDDIAGDMKLGSRTLPNWGLHTIDVNLALGNLVDIVGSESKAWLAKQTGK
ncbi:MAG TPA: DUF3089 domain-containing protein [Candidatus Acidoferrum sp.]|nr:DUF3089 domain-containing protein [Candidatus Acidoferrum sp.]